MTESPFFLGFEGCDHPIQVCTLEYHLLGGMGGLWDHHLCILRQKRQTDSVNWLLHVEEMHYIRTSVVTNESWWHRMWTCWMSAWIWPSLDDGRGMSTGVKDHNLYLYFIVILTNANRARYLCTTCIRGCIVYTCIPIDGKLITTTLGEMWTF
jgi:hypothetical protein